MHYYAAAIRQLQKTGSTDDLNSQNSLKVDGILLLRINCLVTKTVELIQNLQNLKPVSFTVQFFFY